MEHTNFVLSSAIKELNEQGELCPETIKRLEKIREKSEVTVGDLKKNWWFSVSTEELEFLEFVLEDLLNPDSVNMKKEEKEIRDNLLRRIKRIEELSNNKREEE